MTRALLQAAQSGDQNGLNRALSTKSMFSKKASVDFQNPDDGFSALHLATVNGFEGCVSLLIQYGANINIQDSKGMTPLHLASWANESSIAKVLLQNGAVVNQQSLKGETALLIAAQHGNTDVVATLLEYGGDPEMSDKEDLFPLDLAAQFGRDDVVRLLLTMQKELHLKLLRRNSEVRPKILNHSPLHLAAGNGHVKTLKLLIDSGADINLETESGTPIRDAAVLGKYECVRLLYKAGARLNVTEAEKASLKELLDKSDRTSKKKFCAIIGGENSESFVKTVQTRLSKHTREKPPPARKPSVLRPNRPPPPKGQDGGTQEDENNTSKVDSSENTEVPKDNQKEEETKEDKNQGEEGAVDAPDTSAQASSEGQPQASEHAVSEEELPERGALKKKSTRRRQKFKKRPVSQPPNAPAIDEEPAEESEESKQNEYQNVTDEALTTIEEASESETPVAANEASSKITEGADKEEKKSSEKRSVKLEIPDTKEVVKPSEDQKDASKGSPQGSPRSKRKGNRSPRGSPKNKKKSPKATRKTEGGGKGQGKWQPAQQNKCHKCDKTVYQMEQVTVENMNFHKNCLRCEHCDNKVTPGSYAAINGKIYCKPHFKQLFKLKGRYDLGEGDGPTESSTDDPTGAADTEPAKKTSSVTKPEATSSSENEKVVKQQANEKAKTSQKSGKSAAILDTPKSEEEKSDKGKRNSKETDKSSGESPRTQKKASSGSSEEPAGNKNDQQKDSNASEQKTPVNPKGSPQKGKGKEIGSKVEENPQPPKKDDVPAKESCTSSKEKKSPGKWQPAQQNKCHKCDKTVYQMEQVTVENMNFHKNCLRCEHCDNKVTPGSYAAINGKIYCKPHFKQLFKLKGRYDLGEGDEPTESSTDNPTGATDTEPAKKTNSNPKPAKEKSTTENKSVDNISTEQKQTSKKEMSKSKKEKSKSKKESPKSKEESPKKANSSKPPPNPKKASLSAIDPNEVKPEPVEKSPTIEDLLSDGEIKVEDVSLRNRPETSHILKQGKLSKLPQGKRRITQLRSTSAKERWFVLTKHHLRYFDSGSHDKVGKLKGIIYVNEIRLVRQLPSQSSIFQFEIVYTQGTLRCQPWSQTDCDSWIDAITSVATNLENPALEAQRSARRQKQKDPTANEPDSVPMTSVKDLGLRASMHNNDSYGPAEYTLAEGGGHGEYRDVDDQAALGEEAKMEDQTPDETEPKSGDKENTEAQQDSSEPTATTGNEEEELGEASSFENDSGLEDDAFLFLSEAHLERYAPNFNAAEVRTLSEIMTLNEDQLTSIGIVKAGHRKKFFKAVAELE